MPSTPRLLSPAQDESLPPIAAAAGQRSQPPRAAQGRLWRESIFLFAEVLHGRGTHHKKVTINCAWNVNLQAHAGPHGSAAESKRPLGLRPAHLAPSQSMPACRREAPGAAPGVSKDGRARTVAEMALPAAAQGSCPPRLPPPLHSTCTSLRWCICFISSPCFFCISCSTPRAGVGLAGDAPTFVFGQPRLPQDRSGNALLLARQLLLLPPAGPHARPAQCPLPACGSRAR